MRETIAILIPTFGRAHKLKKLLENIEANTTLPHKVYFLLEKQDYISVDKCRRFGFNYIINKHIEYVGAINTGYEQTTEPFIFCGADDIEFHKDWDSEAMRLFLDRKIGIVGVWDSFPVTQTKMHACHFLVRRTYIEEQSGVNDEKNVIYSNAYRHLNCDIETIQTAIGRGAWAFASKAIVEHKHWYIDKIIEKDATYRKCMFVKKQDDETFAKRRKNFEIYLWEMMWKEKLIPVNTVRENILTVVMPVYNALEYTKKTIQSLKDSTFYKYKLIIIDDNSNEETKAYLRTVRGDNIISVFNTSNKLTNANWNKGLEMCDTKYIAIINNDITFSYFWDYFLIEELNDKVWVTSPYQYDNGEMTPYGKTDRAGNIDIRGACFMAETAKLKLMGGFPKDIKFWYGDTWLSWVVPTIYKKETKFISTSVIFHYGSQSTQVHSPLASVIKNDRDVFSKIAEPYSNIEYKNDGSIKNITPKAL